MEKITREQFEIAIEYLKLVSYDIRYANDRYSVDFNERVIYWLDRSKNIIISYSWMYGYKTINITDLDNNIEISEIRGLKGEEIKITKEDRDKLWNDISTILNTKE